MITKNYICILATAALVVSCAPPATSPRSSATTTAAATHAVRPTPTPRPHPSITPAPTPSPGKRTETGTVIGLTTSQITLKTATTTWIIDRTSDTTVMGTLAMGYEVTVTAPTGNWHVSST